MHVKLIFNIDNIEIIIRSEVSNSKKKVSLSHRKLPIGFLLIDVSGVMQISPTFLFMKMITNSEFLFFYNERVEAPSTVC